MQPVSAAGRAAFPSSSVGAAGAAGSTAWPIPLKSEPSTSCTVPEVASSLFFLAAPGMALARVVASASSPGAKRTVVVS